MDLFKGGLYPTQEVFKYPKAGEENSIVKIYFYNLKEEKSISYEWHLSDDHKEATLIESFVDSDGALQRLANHGASPIANEVSEHVDFKSILCLGNAKQDLIDALTPWGAKFQHQFCGYHKEI